MKVILALVSAACAFTMSDISINLSMYLQRYNYVLEEYVVKTKEGYKLGLHRIVSTHRNSTSGPPVLLMHGLDGSSVDFIMNYPEDSLAFNLAKRGYDVWLGNNRGNYFSNNHAYLDHENLNTASLYW